MPAPPTWPSETLVEREVTYTLERDGTLMVVEHVPARVNPETGEQFFSPETVERLQQLLQEQPKPSRVIEAPVFDFAG
jgi:YgiT-type zinc finger domain-containing protein